MRLLRVCDREVNPRSHIDSVPAGTGFYGKISACRLSETTRRDFMAHRRRRCMPIVPVIESSICSVFGRAYKQGKSICHGVSFSRKDMLMKEIGIFDVIGPNMIGPSSSHTAGALRIALLAGRLARSRIVRADFVLYGSFAKTYKGHGTDRALVGGVLGFSTEDRRIRDSFEYAAQAGLEYTFEVNTQETDLHPNTVDITLTTADGAVTRVRGVSTGGGNSHIERIDGVEVRIDGNYTTLLIRQRDTSGVVAAITSALSGSGINIAFMRLYRESKGETAYTIIETDSAIPAEVVREIERHPQIHSAMVIETA